MLTINLKYLNFRPIGRQIQYNFSNLVVFLLISMPSAFDNDNFVNLRGFHVRIYIFKEADWVSVREIVVGADNHCAVMGNLFDLGKIADCVVQNAAQPIVRSICGANDPAHKIKRQNFLSLPVTN